MRGGLCFICTNVFSFCMLRSGSLKRNIYFYLQASKEILMKSRSVKIYRRHAYTTRYFKRVKAVRTTQSFAKMQHVGYICIIDEANIKQIFYNFISISQYPPVQGSLFSHLSQANCTSLEQKNPAKSQFRYYLANVSLC